MALLLTYSEFVSTASTAGLDDQPFEAGDRCFLGYVPVTWGDSPRVEDISEADDYKEVGPFSASSMEEAEWMLLQTFGPNCEVEDLGFA